jgi:hypothetical protein
MQRILSIYDWQRLPAGDRAIITTDLEGQRTVRLRVNAAGPLNIYVQQVDIVDDMFLAHVSGLDEIQFDIVGNYKFYAVGGDLCFDTLDGTRADVEPVDATSFTNIVERQARNPEMEIMELKMRQNAEIRNEMLKQAFMAEIAQMRSELVATREVAATPSTEAPQPHTGQVPSDPQPEQAAGGTSGQPDEV